MRLALKLLSSLAVLVLVVLAVTALNDIRWQRALNDRELESEGRIAKVLGGVVEHVCELRGPDAAKALVETIDANTPRRKIKWRSPDEIARIPGRDLWAELAARPEAGDPVWVAWPAETGEMRRYMYIPIRHDGTPMAAIEAESTVSWDDYAVHESQQTMAVGFVVIALAGVLAIILGHRLIGRPLKAITMSVRALGAGEFVPPAVGQRHDELGKLATELSVLGERLAERDRMRHDDRLRTIGQLASGVAHELGTPLSVVAVRARLIASGEAVGEEAVSNAKAILEQSERMTRLVRQLLDYSRRSAGTTTTLDLRETALRTVEMLEPLAKAYGVALVAESEPGELDVRGDGGQLQQVLTNLVLNGIQALPTGGRLEVASGRGPAGPAGQPSVDRCWIRVTDDGPGIAPENLAHVFEPFFTTKPAGTGTGLGLAVAQAIVEEHGGWIAVKSEPGRGASFTVYLPPAAATGRLAS